MKAITVKFKQYGGGFGGKQYTYMTDDDSVKVGDEVIVDSPSEGMVVCKVTGMGNMNAATKCIVQKIDKEAYRAAQARAEKLRDIRFQLDAKRKEVEEMAIFEMLASKDSEFASLLEQLKEFSK